VRNDYIGKNCPFCQTPIKPSDNVIVCSECEIPHHRECWNENHGCTTYGCRENPAAQSTRQLHRPPPDVIDDLPAEPPRRERRRRSFRNYDRDDDGDFDHIDVDDDDFDAWGRKGGIDKYFHRPLYFHRELRSCLSVVVISVLIIAFVLWAGYSRSTGMIGLAILILILFSLFLRIAITMRRY
jgi:hypothetical protein